MGVIYPSLGFWLLFEKRLSGDQCPRVAQLLTDPRWPWQPALVRPSQMSGEPPYPWPGGKIAAAKLPSTIEDVLRSPSTTGIHLAMSRKDSGNHAFAIVDNGNPRPMHQGISCPFQAIGLSRVPFPAGKRVEPWLALVRELAVVLEAVHGVVWMDADDRYVIARQFVMGSPSAREPPDYPGNEARRIVHARKLLGDRYVRFPGWATFLRSAHVEAIGGREKLLAVVKPPVVHDVGDLLYVQLSTSIEDALAPETEARRQVFIELVQPILVPPAA